MKRFGLRGTMASQSSLGSPCTWHLNPSSAYFSARTMPDLPSRKEAVTSWVLFPIEETIPIPVTTTRLINEPLQLHPVGAHASYGALFGPCQSAPAPINPAPIKVSGRRRGRLAGLEQANAHVGRGVDDLAVGFQGSVRD